MKMGFIAPSSEESEPVSRSIPSICRQKLAKYQVKPMAKNQPVAPVHGLQRLCAGADEQGSAGIETR